MNINLSRVHHGIQLERNTSGKLVLTMADGTVHENVVPVRAFPIASPETGIALVGTDGHEKLWLDSLDIVPEHIHNLISETLRQREFVPEVKRIDSVSSFATPSVWTLQTDRGTTHMTLKGEEDIRRLQGGMLMIADTNGIHYLIRNMRDLDRHSRKILDRFL